jgi:trehalose 6-phosphate synthase/phosphatase
MLGSKIVEIQPNGVSKGTGAQHWLDQGSWDFIVTAGDDTTDEDMFKIMPKEAFTIRIGPDETVATTRLPTPAAMLRLLKELREH